jgi:hypothetical protein
MSDIKVVESVDATTPDKNVDEERTVVAEVGESGVVTSRFAAFLVVVKVVVVVLVVVEVVDVVVHFEQVHARGPSSTSLLTPSLQQDRVCKL